MPKQVEPIYDLAIVGAGPVGLAAAIEAKRCGLSSVVLEKGCVVNAIFEYPTYMTFFTTSELLEIGGHPLVSAREKPDRKDALEYYRLVAAREALPVRQYTEATAIARDGEALAVAVNAKDGSEGVVHARTVVIATGYYDNPNVMGIPGEDLENVSHYYTEAHPFWGLNVTVIGAGNSAADAALDMYRHGVNVTLVHRGPGVRSSVKYWVKPDLENRIREGSIAARFNTLVTEITPTAVLATGPDGEKVEIPTDFTFALTGYMPSLELFHASNIELDADSCVVRDPDTFESRSQPGVYVVGSAAFGRFTNQVFIENGREHARIAVAAIAERLRVPQPA
ncbi:MAG TPA: YpdA family putative bacillithiol disulfide reductase [Deinococcales bacterium]|nr:YpdA family putative bacillithiol disulfide reductase [Deinococcales bacterium]